MIFISAIMSFTFFDNLVKRIRDDMRNAIEKYSYLDWATETWDNTQRYVILFFHITIISYIKRKLENIFFFQINFRKIGK